MRVAVCDLSHMLMPAKVPMRGLWSKKYRPTVRTSSAPSPAPLNSFASKLPATLRSKRTDQISECNLTVHVRTCDRILDQVWHWPTEGHLGLVPIEVVRNAEPVPLSIKQIEKFEENQTLLHLRMFAKSIDCTKWNVWTSVERIRRDPWSSYDKSTETYFSLVGVSVVFIWNTPWERNQRAHLG